MSYRIDSCVVAIVLHTKESLSIMSSPVSLRRGIWVDQSEASEYTIMLQVWHGDLNARSDTSFPPKRKDGGCACIESFQFLQ